MPPKRGRGRPKADASPVAAAAGTSTRRQARAEKNDIARSPPALAKRGRQPKANQAAVEEPKRRSLARKQDAPAPTPTPEPAPTPAKRSGRPRKTDIAVEEASDTTAAPKARGGRGRKVAEPNVDEAPLAIKRRGRPPKDTAQANTVTTPAKNGRTARTRKQDFPYVPVDEQVPAPAKRGRRAAVEPAPATEPEPEPAPVPAPTKRAGRPPKSHPAVNDASPPKRRGRPSADATRVAGNSRVAKTKRASTTKEATRSTLRTRQPPAEKTKTKVAEPAPRRRGAAAKPPATKKKPASKKEPLKKTQKGGVAKQPAPKARRGHVFLEIPKKYQALVEEFIQNLDAGDAKPNEQEAAAKASSPEGAAMTAPGDAQEQIATVSEPSLEEDQASSVSNDQEDVEMADAEPVQDHDAATASSLPNNSVNVQRTIIVELPSPSDSESQSSNDEGMPDLAPLHHEDVAAPPENEAEDDQQLRAEDGFASGDGQAESGAMAQAVVDGVVLDADGSIRENFSDFEDSIPSVREDSPPAQEIVLDEEETVAYEYSEAGTDKSPIPTVAADLDLGTPQGASTPAPERWGQTDYPSEGDTEGLYQHTSPLQGQSLF
ncbi:hypothetical protein BS50DRAFT_14012 [Corynespora cassiicola Philippines]|uniref:Uncharacterized protein n=1 Tax=Corynespora cassiicola Philippines TaxID=1448308 RepID=A0A2T2P9M5_CORCC|nr:hypothetical protein BS50DRAFT_14012 [Corynespora cassiicola Philippines]